jgi:hypothetical protein
MQSIQTNPIGKGTKRRPNRAKDAGWILLSMGAALLLLSIIYSSSIPAFIGLGLVFWGIILSYIRNEQYVKEPIFEATAMSSIATLDQMIQEMGYAGKAVYLSPRYFKDPEAGKAYIPKQKEGQLPTPEQIQNQETRVFIENPQGILVTPPGAELTKLFERNLGISFTRVDMTYVEQKLPKLLVEDLEIAQEVQIKIEGSKITIDTKDSVYKNLSTETKRFPNVYNSLGSPLSSAFACALAKATGKPIIIENETASEDGKSIKIEYRAIGEEKKT